MHSVSDQSNRTDSPEVKSLTVLLIEDDPLFSQTVRDLIARGRESFETEAVESLGEGLDRVARGGIDLILLDLSLPDSNGILTLERTRRGASSIPIIVLTACDDDEIALRAVQAGAQDYLVKDQIDGNLMRRTMRYAIERHRIESALRASEERLREQVELLNAARDAILVQDLEGRILFWNRAAERIYGWTQEEVLGTPSGDWAVGLILTNWENKTEEIRGSLIKHGEWIGEMENYTKDGRTLIVERRCVLMPDRDGRPKSILIVNADITEKKRFEAQFLRMQRMESLGGLASGIAHDLNNWLSPILTSIHTLQQRFTDPNSQKWLSIIRKSAERSRDLIDHVLTFAKGKEGERVALNTSRLISDVSKIVSETLPRSFTIEVELPEDLWGVLGDATQIHQVSMNLCLNARDAMPGGGRLSLGAANIVLSEDDVWMVEDVKPGKYVQISVTDTGIGMSQELIDRAFEPFFTTKKDGLGTGLGLSITLGIVRSHGGFINVTSAVGQGTKFIVHLPASHVVTDDRPTLSEKMVPTGNGELVLVVDDEEDIREITVATLESCGYRALGAISGQDALNLCSEHKSEIKLMIADLALSGLNDDFFGNSILDQIKIIGTSGLRSPEQIERSRRARIETMLWKPYTAQQLLAAIEKNLSQP